MGGSKSNTGIGFVDNAVDFTANNVTRTAKDLGKKAEGSFQRLGNDFAAMGSGNFNNTFNTLLNAGLTLASGGTLNIDAVGDELGGETASERAVREATETAEATELQFAADQEAKRLGELNDVMTASAKARAITPGRSALMLAGATNKGRTLLSGANSGGLF